MPVATQTTVDRLDKPSAYYLGRVSTYFVSFSTSMLAKILTWNVVYQNKKRKYGRDRDDGEAREKTPEEPEDPLKDAATLYVGNLCVKEFSLQSLTLRIDLHFTGHSILRKNRYMSFLPSNTPRHAYKLAMLKCSRCGEIKRLVMGLDRFHKTPCGFCFVEYYNHQDALDCMKYIGGTKLDERIIRTDLDPGFQEGRQYG